ncbi:MAG: DUF6335 family protein [Microcoleaceae cyanobacterium]
MTEQNSPEYQAKVIPDQPVAATEPIPERHDVDDIASEMGVEIANEEPVQMKEKLDQRDEQRWQLDPDSAEDH